MADACKKTVKKQMGYRLIFCSLLFCCLSGCYSAPAEPEKMDEAAILEMGPEEFEAYQKRQKELEARRRANFLSIQKRKSSYERNSVEKRKRLGDPGRATLMTEPANSVFPWKNSEKNQSEIILERQRNFQED